MERLQQHTIPLLNTAGEHSRKIHLLLLFFLSLCFLLSRLAVGDSVLQSPAPAYWGNFGRSVAVLPDVTGDGKDEIIVGAWREDGGATDAGLAYVFNGSTGALLYLLTSENPEVGGIFGFSVASVPDLNQDGKADILVGAESEDGASQTNNGRAYVFSGATGARLFTIPPTEAEQGAEFGYAVAGITDVNGDGRGDLIVSANQRDAGATNSGCVYLLSGLNGGLIFKLQSPNPESDGFFGGSVSSIADVNGDGKADIIVSAEYENVNAVLNAGRVHIFSGGTGALLRTLVSPNQEQDGRFGRSVSSLPDVNGNGTPDVLVGAYLEDGNAVVDSGRAHLFDGATGAWIRSFVSPNAEVSGWFGQSVSGLTDFNGDGKGDVLIGSSGFSGTGDDAGGEDGSGIQDSGRAYIFNGAQGFLLRTLVSPSPAVNGWFGCSVAGRGDFNADGRSDAVIGAFQENTPSQTKAGQVYVFLATPPAPTPSPSPTAPPTATRTPTITPSRTPSPTSPPLPSPTPSPSPTASCQLRILSPNGGEQWQQASAQFISWQTNGNPAKNVRIDLYKGGIFLGPVTPETPDDGSEAWTIPADQVPGADYQLKLSYNDNPACLDWSDGYFSITALPTPTPTCPPLPSKPKFKTKISSVGIPKSMTAGQQVNVSFIVTNRGNVAWSRECGYRLVKVNPADPFGPGQIELPPGVAVAPGQSWTFDTVFTAPGVAGSYTTQWQMVADGIGGIGKAYKKKIKVVSAAQALRELFSTSETGDDGKEEVSESGN